MTVLDEIITSPDDIRYGCTYEKCKIDFTNQNRHSIISLAYIHFIDCDIVSNASISFVNCSFRTSTITIYENSLYLTHSLILDVAFSANTFYSTYCTYTGAVLKGVSNYFSSCGDSFTLSAFFSCKPRIGDISRSTIYLDNENDNDFSSIKTDHTSAFSSAAIRSKFPLSQLCPTEGPFVGYKKLANNLVATLLIPKSAARVSSLGRKCRASKAKVLSIEDPTSGKKFKSGYSYFYSQPLKYKVGRTIRPDSFDSDPSVDCSHGIHFFMTKEEAINYGTN